MGGWKEGRKQGRKEGGREEERERKGGRKDLNHVDFFSRSNMGQDSQSSSNSR